MAHDHPPQGRLSCQPEMRKRTGVPRVYTRLILWRGRRTLLIRTATNGHRRDRAGRHYIINRPRGADSTPSHPSGLQLDGTIGGPTLGWLSRRVSKLGQTPLVPDCLRLALQNHGYFAGKDPRDIALSI